VKKNGGDAFERAAEQALPLSAFILQEIKKIRGGLTSVEQRSAFLADVKEVANTLPRGNDFARMLVGEAYRVASEAGVPNTALRLLAALAALAAFMHAIEPIPVTSLCLGATLLGMAGIKAGLVMLVVKVNDLAPISSPTVVAATTGGILVRKATRRCLNTRGFARKTHGEC